MTLASSKRAKEKSGKTGKKCSPGEDADMGDARLMNHNRDLDKRLKLEMLAKEARGTLKLLKSRFSGSYRSGNLLVDELIPIDKTRPFWQEFLRIEELKDQRLKQLDSNYIAKNVSDGYKYSVPGTEWRDYLITEHGLSQNSVVFDYGCGGFRLGAPLIDFLHSGNYIGFDLSRFFYENGGQRYLEELGLSSKINGVVETQGRRLNKFEEYVRPDFVISMNTLMHVSDDELDTFFFNISGLASETTKILIDFLPSLFPLKKNSLTFGHRFKTLNKAMSKHGLSLVRLYGHTMLLRKDNIT